MVSSMTQTTNSLVLTNQAPGRTRTGAEATWHGASGGREVGAADPGSGSPKARQATSSLRPVAPG